MATIGTFTANSKGEFNGVIKTLTLNTKATLRPVEKEGEKCGPACKRDPVSGVIGV